MTKKRVNIIYDFTIPKQKTYLRVICISDTHNLHNNIDIPSCDADVIIHAGDFTNRGDEQEVREFLEWYSNIPIKHKLFIMGNHEYPIRKQLKKISEDYPQVIFLNEEKVIIDNISFYGEEAYDGICGLEADFGEIDILITHVPPAGILDKNDKGYPGGSEKNLAFVINNKPQIHVFGHIHDSSGIQLGINSADTADPIQKILNNIVFVNAAMIRNILVPNFRATLDESSSVFSRESIIIKTVFNDIRVFDIKKR